MPKSFVIKSADSSTTLKFSLAEMDYFTVTFRGKWQYVETEIWGYTDSYGLAGLLQKLANQWRGWDDEMDWWSLESDFAVQAISDSRGHIDLKIELKNFNTSEPWTFEGTIRIEAGMLDSIAHDAQNFFVV